MEFEEIVYGFITVQRLPDSPEKAARVDELQTAYVSQGIAAKTVREAINFCLMDKQLADGHLALMQRTVDFVRQQEAAAADAATGEP